MADSQDVNTLRRRGRRRLVGAIALVLLAAIILPMVFDPEPKPSAPPVSVRIPGEDDAGFAPKVAPKLQTPTSPGVSAATPVAALSEPPKQAAKTAETPAPKGLEQPVAATGVPPHTASPAAAEQFVVQVGAFADPAGVIEKLKAARLPYHTEPVAVAKGKVTRVRVGPYATREAAEEAQRQLQRLGLKPGNVLAKS